MPGYYLTKNYKEISSAGNKAKTDIEDILKTQGYKEAGLKRSYYKNNIVGFLVTFISVVKVFFTVKKGDILILQYPLKKYYSFVCKATHLKGGKVVTVIHDLGSFRRKKLTVEKEKKRLQNTDFLIVHNESMKKWLLENGFDRPLYCLEIFDYLSDSENKQTRKMHTGEIKVIYAGALNYKKNRFIYKVDAIERAWHFNLYGSGFEWDKIHNKDKFSYKGFIPSDELIKTAEGDFGLIWDGESIETCSGTFGEYLKYNNPHKTSLYIRCHLPVIIWKEAALAPFVTENGIGITISSLEELNKILHSITKNEYQYMIENIQRIDKNISSGFYISKAVRAAEKYLVESI